MTRKLSPSEKKSRKPAQRACTFCHSKHLQCSNERPCKNCVKRNIGDKCHDIERKRAKYLKPKADSYGSPEQPELFDRKEDSVESPWVAEPTRSSIPKTTDKVMDRMLYQLPAQKEVDVVPIDDNISDIFSSNYLNQEYLKLGDILLHSHPTSPSPSNTSTSEYNMEDGNWVTSSIVNHKMDPLAGTYKQLKDSKSKDSRPFISLGFPNGNTDDQSSKNPIMDQVSANSTEYISPLISHHLYQSVQDIYSNNVINFDYPSSYHSLTKFLRDRFSGNNLPQEERQSKRRILLIILKIIASYRPTFISAHKSLFKPFDLQFLEMSFQRSLLDYEKLSQLNSSPSIIWRRTGEIVSISDDILSLLGYNLGDILSKRTFIVELMYDDESILRYFELFKSVAVGNLRSTIITKCKLMKDCNKKPMAASTANVEDKSEFIEFCAVWTVKRDLFDLPMLILGQFLPILPAGDGVRMY